MKTKFIFLMAAMAAMFLSCDNDSSSLYNVTIVNDSEGGAVELNYEKAAPGTDIVILAKPAQNKRLVKWTFSTGVVLSGATTSIKETINNPVSFKMPAGDVTVTPVYGDYQFRVVVNQPEGGAAVGSATATPSDGLLPGASVTIEATVADDDYIFDHWEINSGNIFPVPTGNPATFNMPQGDVTVTPVFKIKVYYKITVDDQIAEAAHFDHIVANDADSEAALNGDGVLLGTRVSYTGYAEDGYEVFQWSIWNDKEGKVVVGETVTFELLYESNHALVPWVRAVSASERLYKVSVDSTIEEASNFDYITANDANSEKALNGDGVPVGTVVSYTGHALEGYEVFQWSIWNDKEGKVVEGDTVTFELTYESNHALVPWVRAISGS